MNYIMSYCLDEKKDTGLQGEFSILIYSAAAY